MLMYSKAKACFKHSNFFKVKDLEHRYQPQNGSNESRRMGTRTGTYIDHEDRMRARQVTPEIQLRTF